MAWKPYIFFWHLPIAAASCWESVPKECLRRKQHNLLPCQKNMSTGMEETASYQVRPFARPAQCCQVTGSSFSLESFLTLAGDLQHYLGFNQAKPCSQIRWHWYMFRVAWWCILQLRRRRKQEVAVERSVYDALMRIWCSDENLRVQKPTYSPLLNIHRFFSLEISHNIYCKCCPLTKELFSAD